MCPDARATTQRRQVTMRRRRGAAQRALDLARDRAGRYALAIVEASHAIQFGTDLEELERFGDLLFDPRLLREVVEFLAAEEARVRTQRLEELLGRLGT